jgi:hypothetical protein
MDIESVVPDIEGIEDDGLRTGVATAWMTAAAVNLFDVVDLPEQPWLPSERRAEEPEPPVDHVQDLTACAVGLAESLPERRPDLATSTPLSPRRWSTTSPSSTSSTARRERTRGPAGASLLRRSGGFATQPTRRGGPHRALALAKTSVEPATLEAELVVRADEAAATTARRSASVERNR